MNLNLTKEQALEALETYFQLMTFNGASRIFRIAGETNIFENLAGPCTPAELAERCGLKEGPVQLFLEGLETLTTLRVYTSNMFGLEAKERLKKSLPNIRTFDVP